MKVQEIMTQPVIVAREDTTLEEIARTMLERGIGAMPVVDVHGKLSGIITESDFTAKDCGIPFSTYRAPQVFGKWLTSEGCELIYEAARQTTAKQIMNRSVTTISEGETVERLLEMILDSDLKRIPVVRDGVPVGIVARHDLLKLMREKSVNPPIAQTTQITV
jgi:CBS domain-containing protein